MPRIDIFEKNYRLAVRFPGQEGAEERGTDAQYEFVSFEHFTAASQQHVRKHFGGAELLQNAEETVVMVVPF